MAEQTEERAFGQLAVQLRAQEVSKLLKQLTAQQVLAEGRGLRDLAKQIQRRINQEKRNLNALLVQVPEPIASVIRNG
jgi:hypothetical protein